MRRKRVVRATSRARSVRHAGTAKTLTDGSATSARHRPSIATPATLSTKQSGKTGNQTALTWTMKTNARRRADYEKA